ncbi:DUF2752 domain-containing protein [Robertkochia solimangrovi]|nr:DUF2752 domain-containing protein [Robertkochia solimangrovi]
MLPCLNKKLFGVECMGCGMQRAFWLLIDGKFSEAFFMYPAIYTLIPLFAFLIVKNFLTIKYANKILVILVTINIAIIAGNYLLKLLNH